MFAHRWKIEHGEGLGSKGKAIITGKAVSFCNVDDEKHGLLLVSSNKI
jgi:hypothetical protein